MIRPAKRSKTTAAVVEAAAAASPIGAISDDLLCEVFVRLPSRACLARAAATCKAWRHLITNRRLSLLHRPLLGFFINAFAAASERPRFISAPAGSPDIAPALRHGDLLLKSLPKGDWSIADCHNGRLLLGRRCHFDPLGIPQELAVYDPLAQHCQKVPTDDLLSADAALDDQSRFLGAGLRAVGDDSFEVVCALLKPDGPDACVFSPSSAATGGAWHHVPCSDALAKQFFSEYFRPNQLIHRGGSLVWGPYTMDGHGSCMAVLNKNTAKFSVVHVLHETQRLPTSRLTIVGAGDDEAGDQESPVDGAELRVVEVSDLVLRVWGCRKHRWALEKEVSLHAAVNKLRGERQDCALKNFFTTTDVHASNGGYVFVCIQQFGYLAVHLKTMQMQRLRWISEKYGGFIHPFTTVTWPPKLLTRSR